MLSSIILLLLVYYGIVVPEISLGFWKWYFLCYGIECVILIKAVPKLLDWLDEVRK